MFKCKICTEKDARILELKEQLSYFRKVLNPEPRINRYEIEADNLLGGGGKEKISTSPIIDEEAEAKENEKIQREQDALFSGNWIESN